MKKNKLDNLTPKYKYISPDITNIIFGCISVGSLIFSIISAHLNRTETWTFFSQLVLVLGFVCMGIYYQIQHAKNANYTFENKKLTRLNKNRLTVINSQAECIHVVTHYSRNILHLFDENIANFKLQYSEEKIHSLELENILKEIDFFFINITSSIRDYFTSVTNSQCAVTIKILQETQNEIYVKTLFRDPVSLKKRRKSDEKIGKSGKYPVKENTAFETIMNSKYKNLYFAHNNLSDLANTGIYKNGNPEWRKFYNATLVTGIGITTSKSKKEILGFLTVDNFDGHLTDLSSIELMHGISDLLHVIILKYVHFIKCDLQLFQLDYLATDHRLKRILDWT